MRKSMLMAALAAVSIFAVACGGGNGNDSGINATDNSGGNDAACTGDTGSDACTGDTGGETGGDACGGETGDTGGEASTADAYALYRNEGASWLIKNVMTVGGNEMVTYTKNEVKSVADDHAVVVTTSLDKDKKESEYAKPSERKVDFTPATTTDTGGATTTAETSEEEITVEAGTFNCTKTVTDASTIWMSKEYPGLMVKMETETMKSELVEFNKG